MFASNISTHHNGEVIIHFYSKYFNKALKIRYQILQRATSLAHTCAASQRTFNLSRKSRFLRYEVKEWVTSEENHSGMH